MNLLILVLVFTVTTLAGASIVYLAMHRRIMQVRLTKIMEESIEQSIGEVGREAHNASLTNLVATWLKEAFEQHGKIVLPRDQWEQSYLKTRLVTAGFRKDPAPAIFQGIRVLLAMTLPSIYLLSQLIVGVRSVEAIAVSLALAAAGFYLPSYYIYRRIKKRQGRIAKTLPNVLDMLVICVEAGLGLDAAIQRVGDEMKLAGPEISEELQLTGLELRAGKSRAEAFRNIGIRTGLDDMKNLVAVLIQTDRFGTSVATALRSQADGIRIKRRQKLEEQAAKTSVKLIFPLVFFIFPTILVVVVGPAVIKIIRVLIPALQKGSGS